MKKAALAVISLVLISPAALADELNGANTAWILTSTALVLFTAHLQTSLSCVAKPKMMSDTRAQSPWLKSLTLLHANTRASAKTPQKRE